MNGLLGKSLKHSLSKEIHQAFGCEDYELYETTDPISFLQTNPIHMVNVTIPYKETVLPFLDELDPYAMRVQAVNTIVYQNAKWVGYNTDYDGFLASLNHYQVDCQDQVVVIIGHGGMAKTAYDVVIQRNAKAIYHLVRTKKDPQDVLFEEINLLKEATIIINATPLGMYPHEEDSMPFSLKSFPMATIYIDTIYNPLFPTWYIEAKSLHLKAINGLFQLVVQAKRAREIADHKTFPWSLVYQVYRSLYLKQLNIVLIGLSLSGKTTIGKALSQKRNLPWIDTDQWIEAREQRSIDTIFERDGEASFRQLEEACVHELAQSRGIILSTGGGMIENPRIIQTLKHTSLLIYLKRASLPIKGLDITGRPLLKFPEMMMKREEKRLPLYEAAADFTVSANLSVNQIVHEIEAYIDEVINR